MLTTKNFIIHGTPLGRNSNISKVARNAINPRLQLVIVSYKINNILSILESILEENANKSFEFCSVQEMQFVLYVLKQTQFHYSSYFSNTQPLLLLLPHLEDLKKYSIVTTLMLSA